MTDQKAENLLNLAVSTPEGEREKTDELNVGYDAGSKSWELIVTYSGDLRGTLEIDFPQVRVRELLGGFAIIKVPEELVEDVINIEEIEYAEKPKRLYFAVNRGRAASCFLPVQRTLMMVGDCRNHSVSQNAEGEYTDSFLETDGDETAENPRVEDLSGCGVLIGIVDSGIDYFHEDFRNMDGSSRILFLYDQVLGRVFTKAELDEASVECK